MVIVQYLANGGIFAMEGPFKTWLDACDYVEQRDHFREFKTRIMRLDPPRFEPDTRYRQTG